MTALFRNMLQGMTLPDAETSGGMAVATGHSQSAATSKKGSVAECELLVQFVMSGAHSGFAVWLCRSQSVTSPSGEQR